jgi:pimeloyl-ACP methyl ester carboxylesterase
MRHPPARELPATTVRSLGHAAQEHAHGTCARAHRVVTADAESKPFCRRARDVLRTTSGAPAEPNAPEEEATMCMAMNGLPVEFARSYRAEGDHLQSSTGHRVSVPWQRMLLVARDAARTAGAVRTLPAAALTKGTHLGAPGTGAQTTAGGHAPVVLVHGYGATPDCWKPLTRRLQVDGFDRVYAFSYNPFTGGLPELGQALADGVTAMMERSGSDTVHLVGHSLGGLLVRLATEWLGLWSQAATVVTIATPHHGCPLA